jgi:hypothetical protein
MSLPSSLLTTTCDIYRPLGAPSPTVSGVPCQLVPAFAQGQPVGPTALIWTHYLLVNPGVDIRDGCTRGAGLDSISYADGDGVVIPGGAGNTRYAVVWVEYVYRGQANEHKRVYLIRDQPAWPGP